LIHIYLKAEEKGMHFGEAEVVGTSERSGGTKELELKTVCPGSNYERLNVVVGSHRLAVPLDRPRRGASRQFKVTMQADSPLNRGDKVLIEFFYPGEQAGVRCGDLRFGDLNAKPSTLRHPSVWKAI
jgi:hypothetical protein